MFLHHNARVRKGIVRKFSQAARIPMAGVVALNAPDVLMPKWIRMHPIVGLGRGGDPRREGGITVFEAYAWIMMHPSVEWTGYLDAPVGTIKYEMRIHEDPSQCWGWRKKFARQFVDNVLANGLITDNLHAALMFNLRSAIVIKRDAIPRKTRAAVLAKTSGKCAYCGVLVTLDSFKPTSYEADHVLSVDAGGSNDIANLIPSCRSCNSKKRAGTALKFMGGGHAN